MFKSSKKGFFFTILAIMLVSVFIVVFTSTSTLREQQSFSSAQTEALLLNSFTEQLEEEYLRTAMKVAGVSTINALTAYVNKTLIPLVNPEAAFISVASAGVFSTIVEVNPAANALGAADLMFTMTFANQSSATPEEIVSVGTVNGRVDFGGAFGIRQEFYINTTNRLTSFTLSITNDSAVSNYITALIYEGGELVGFADAFYQDNLPLEFMFQELIQLNPASSHYIYLFAPYNPSDAYNIEVADVTAYECLGLYPCNADTVEYNNPAGSEIMLLPIDLQLDEPSVRGGSFGSLVRNMELLAMTDMNIILEINASNIAVYQDESPWAIDISGDFNITTRHTTVSFFKERHMEVNVSIIDAYDPLSFFLSDDTGGVLPIRTINASNITLWDVPGVFNVQYGSGTYIHHTATTKYMDRFSNDHTGSACCGIAYLIPQELADFGKMYLDDSYLGGLSCDVDTPHYWISGYNNNFKFTIELVEFFGLDDGAILHDCSLPS